MKYLALLTLAAALAACAKNSPMSPPPTQLTLGVWGGDRVQVAAGDSVTQVWNGCMFGDFAGPIHLDVSGRFAVNGSFTPYVFSSDMPAQLSGQVVGQTLTFAIAVNDTINKRALSFGPEIVVLGKPANIVICPG